MANSGSSITYRPISNTPPSSPFIDKDDEPKPKFALKINISLSCPLTFNIPSTIDATVQRITRNFANFYLIYATFIWAVLIITLIPERKFSLLLLIITTNFVVMYLLLLRAFPSGILKWIDKRLILGLFAIAMAVEMIVTEAGLHLLFTLVGSIPVILFHAYLYATEETSVTEENQAAHFIVDDAV